MEKLLVVSALKDDCYQKNAAHFLEKHLEDVKSGAEKFAQMSGAKILMTCWRNSCLQARL